MANACVDPQDFQTDAGGRLQLNPEALQTPTQTFTRTLAGAPNAYAIVPDITPLAVVVPGKYVVAWEAHGNATNTPAGSGTVVATSAQVGIGLNGALVGGSETMVQLNLQGSPSVGETEPAYQLHGSGGGHRILDLVVGDLISLFAARSSDPGTTTEIISSNQGRSRITMWRIGPS